ANRRRARHEVSSGRASPGIRQAHRSLDRRGKAVGHDEVEDIFLRKTVKASCRRKPGRKRKFKGRVARRRCDATHERAGAESGRESQPEKKVVALVRSLRTGDNDIRKITSNLICF